MARAGQIAAPCDGCTTLAGRCAGAAGDGRSASGASLKFEPNEALAPGSKAQAAIKTIAIHKGGRCAAGSMASALPWQAVQRPATLRCCSEIGPQRFQRTESAWRTAPPAHQPGAWESNNARLNGVQPPAGAAPTPTAQCPQPPWARTATGPCSCPATTGPGSCQARGNIRQ